MTIACARPGTRPTSVAAGVAGAGARTASVTGTGPLATARAITGAGALTIPGTTAGPGASARALALTLTGADTDARSTLISTLAVVLGRHEQQRSRCCTTRVLLRSTDEGDRLL